MALVAAFLDRDGTIIEDAHYPKHPDQVRLLPGAVEGLKLLRRKGYLIFVVSNQSGVGRGLIQESEFLAVHRRFCEVLQQNGVEIAEFSYCLHHPDDPCLCRKPKTGLVPRKYQDQRIDFKHSVVIGDRDSDLELGVQLGAKSILVRTGKGAVTESQWPSPPPFLAIYDGLLQAVLPLPDVASNA